MNRALALLTLALLAVLWVLGPGRGRSERVGVPAPIEAPARDAGTSAGHGSRAMPAAVETGAARAERLPAGEGSVASRRGALEVRVRDSAGRAPGVPLELRIRDKDAPGRTTAAVGLDEDGRATVEVPGGFAAPQLTLSAPHFIVRPPSALADVRAPSVASLLHQEELPASLRRVHDVTLRLEPWTLRAVLTDPSAEPLAGARVEITASRLGVHAPVLVTTGPAGELVLGTWIREAHLADISSLELRWLRGGPPAEDDPRATVALELFRAKARGERDLGTVVLTPRVLLAAGRMEYADGEAVDGASVRLERLARPPGNPREDPTWVCTGLVAQVARGDFSLRGAVPPGALRLVPVFYGNERVSAAVRRGARDHLITLARYGHFGARVLLEPEVDREQVELRLSRQGDPDAVQRAAWSSDGGSVYASELEPGAWDLGVFVHGRSVERVAGLLVGAGRGTRDPRLDPIDLRGRLHSFALEVARADGAPLRNVRVEALGGRGAGRQLFARSSSKTVWCAGSVDLAVGAHGCREVIVPGAATDFTVRLDPGLPVAISLDDLPEFHGSPEWKLVLRPAARSPECALDFPLALEGPTELLLDAPGTWQVELRFARRGNWLHFEQGTSIGLIEVRDEPDRTQRFELRAPEDYFERVAG